jgi:hypothetical protein
MSERDDHQPTSDDLIRRARDGFGVRDGEAPPHSLFGDDAPAAPVVRDPLPPTVFPGDDARRDYRSTTTAPAPAPSTTPDDGGIEFTPPPVPRRRSGPGGLQRFGGWILVGLLVGGGFLWRVFDDTKPVEDLTVGDCIDEPQNEIITSVETVGCDTAHDYEVYSVIQVPHSLAAPYPGDDELFFEVLDICFGYFSGYVGADYAESIYDINAIYPTQESWDDEDDREATCLVAQYDAAGNIVPVTGTVRNSGR